MYPSVPEEPLRESGEWPQLTPHELDECPECGEGFVTFRTLTDRTFYNGPSQFGTVPPFPHIFYQCGGGWRKVYDHWEGFCGKPKTVQLELQFTEEEL